MDPKVNALIDNLLRQGGAEFSSYEDPASSYELQAFESFLVSQGRMSPADAKVTAIKASQQPHLAAKLRAAMNKAGQGLMAIDEDIAATFTLTVKRISANIAQDLPIAMLGALAAKNGYRQALTGYLGAGTTLTSVEIGESDGQPDQALFTFTNGASVDTVSIQSDTYPYPSLLESTVTDTLSANKVRVELSDKTQTRQYRNPIIPSVANMFGAAKQNQATAANFRTPQDFQEGIVDIPARIDFDKETSAIHKIINVVGLEVNYTWFVRKFNRVTSKDLG